MKEKIFKFPEHEASAAKLVKDDTGAITGLISYNTRVITIDADGFMTVNGLYSMTTRKHIGWFMRLFGMHYQTAKHIFEDGYQMNVYTGEVRE